MRATLLSVSEQGNKTKSKKEKVALNASAAPTKTINAAIKHNTSETISVIMTIWVEGCIKDYRERI